MNKYDNLIKSFEELLQDKKDLLLLGYDVSGLTKSIEKATNEA